LAACDSQYGPESSSSTGGGGGARVTTNTHGGGPVPQGRHVFKVSASGEDPNASMTEAPDGEFDAYLWLISSNLGVAAMEFDLRHDGATRPENWFTAAPTNIGLTWDAGGEMDVAVGSCPHSHALIGTFHLVASEGDVRVEIIPGSPDAGVVPCDYDVIQDFECAPLVWSSGD
jgi:hypothetical protein